MAAHYVRSRSTNRGKHVQFRRLGRVSIGELVNLQVRYGGHADRRKIRQDYRHGFSILKTNRETGARTCEIYLPNAQRPLQIDDEGLGTTSTLALPHRCGRNTITPKINLSGSMR